MTQDSERGLRLTGDPRAVERKPISQEYRPFTDQEKELLIKDRALFIDLTRETIEDEQKAGRPFRYITNGGDRLLKARSTITQAAFYPDPGRFFILNSGNKNLRTQEKLAKKDGQELRKRLGLKDDSLDVVIPDQASTLTELIFQYLDMTTQKGKAVWLFGSDYGHLHGRTKNPLNKFGLAVAMVGADPNGGVSVNAWNRDNGHDWVRVVRLVVAKKK